MRLLMISAIVTVLLIALPMALNTISGLFFSCNKLVAYEMYDLIWPVVVTLISFSLIADASS